MRMKPVPSAMLSVALLFLVSSTAEALPGGRMTNRDVLDLVNAGLSEEVVLAKIAGSEVDFDTSTKAIVELKKAKVPENVITAMIVRETGSQYRDDDEPSTTPAPSLDTPMRVRLRAGDATHDLEGTFPRDRYVNAVVALLWFKRLRGETAAVEIAERSPVIVLPRARDGVKVNLSGVFLVKLDVDHDDEVREYRLDWGTPFRFVMDMVPEDDYVVRYEVKEEGDLLLISPRQPLKKGQYALLDESQLAYDFGVR